MARSPPTEQICAAWRSLLSQRATAACRSPPRLCWPRWLSKRVRGERRSYLPADLSTSGRSSVPLRSAAGVGRPAGGGSSDPPAADGGRRQSQVSVSRLFLWPPAACSPLHVCLLSCSVAVVECAGVLAELHPAAFVTRLIPRLKEEMFSGEKLLRRTNVFDLQSVNSPLNPRWQRSSAAAFPSCTASAVFVCSGSRFHAAQRRPGEHARPP